jgi:hypothetical protein
MSRPLAPHRWGAILAGVEGARLRPLTRALIGDDRPKQFCAILGGDTSLLEETRRRVMLGVAPQRTLVGVTRTQERFYLPALAPMRTEAAWSSRRTAGPRQRCCTRSSGSPRWLLGTGWRSSRSTAMCP